MAAPTTQQQIDAAVAAQSAGRSALADAAREAAAAYIAAMGEKQWYSDAAVAALADAIAAQVQGAQTQAAALTDAYLATLAGLSLGKNVQPVGPVSVTALRGIRSSQVYQRLGSYYRYERSLGLDDAGALRLTLQRAETMTQTDTTLAMRAQAQKFMTRRKIQKYRRIIRPEASKSGTCGLCIAAADRVYYRSTLLPVHDNCECEIAPIIGNHDPGYSLNRADLDALYAAAGSTGRQDLSRVRITTHHHGELGPVLAEAGQSFRGPAAVALAA